MSVTESPANPAFDVEAERVECPLKILVSIPASLRIFLIRPGIVELNTGLWCLTKLKKSWLLSFPHHTFVLLRYSSKVATSYPPQMSKLLVKVRVSLLSMPHGVFQ